MLFLIVFIGVLSPDAFIDKVEAQTREKVVKRKKTRSVRKRTRRRVRRRVTRKAHLRYRHLPKYRSVVVNVPSGSIVVTRGINSYHYHGGVYYTKRDRGFVVVRPVGGIRIKALPVGHRLILTGKRKYYYYYGTFYTSVGQNGYEVIDAPTGAVVEALPEGYEVVSRNDQEYYLLDEVYYQEVDADEFEDKVGYEVVVL